MAFLRQPLQVVEIIQPLCSRDFGVSPCDATGDKCWNTDATCKFRAALDLTETVTLRFVRPDAHEWIDSGTAFQPALAIPALESYRTAPTVLNVASGSKNKSPLGYRAVAQIRIRDFPWNDVGTDPYLASRSYDPIERGSFWSKWLVRNPFHVGYTIRIYEGERGDALADMIKREYVIEKIDAGRDGVTITAKDILRKITDTGITAPTPSPGVLSGDLSASATTLTLAGATTSDYPATGYLRLGSELISYTGRSGAGDITFTGLTRGVLGTSAAEHSQGATAQRVLAYEDERFDGILRDLLFEWGGIDASYEDADWTDEADEWRPEFIFTGYVTEPVKVDDLVGEICLQALVNVWWDERTQKIMLRAQRPDPSPPELSDDGHILAGSYSIKELPEERASQVHVYYKQRTPAASLTDKKNFERVAVYIDVTRQEQYGGEPAVRELFCRFIQTDAIAGNLGATYLGRFRDVRREVTFDLADPDEVWTGDSLKITHFLDVDATGAAVGKLWLVTSAEATEPGARYSFVAEDHEMVGVLWEWVDDTIPEWGSATDEQKETIGYWLTDDDLDLDGNPRPFRWL